MTKVDCIRCAIQINLIAFARAAATSVAVAITITTTVIAAAVTTAIEFVTAIAFIAARIKPRFIDLAEGCSVFVVTQIRGNTRVATLALIMN